MNDNEIIRVLECCSNPECEKCKKCPLYDDLDCRRDLLNNSLNLIKRQQAEIERLQKHNTEMAFKHYRDGAKEFAERVHGIISPDYDGYHKAIDKLLEEMEKGGAK